MSETYRVWLADEFKQYDEDERHDNSWNPAKFRDGLSRTAGDAREAAQMFADYCHARRDGWEWTWPIDVIVHDGTQYWQVQVDRETVPEFCAHRPTSYDLPPRGHHNTHNPEQGQGEEKRG